MKFTWCLHLLISSLTMDNCLVCDRQVNRLPKQISCSLYCAIYHMKCISLGPSDLSELCQTPIWYCRNCRSELFPFNQIEDDELFVAEINTFRSNVVSLNTSSLEVLFIPFELNEDDDYSHLCEIDPDVNFYNKIGSHIGSSCNYYFEDYFLDALSKSMNLILRTLQSHYVIWISGGSRPIYHLLKPVLIILISIFLLLVYRKLGLLSTIAICMVYQGIILQRCTDLPDQVVELVFSLEKTLIFNWGLTWVNRWILWNCCCWGG